MIFNRLLRNASIRQRVLLLSLLPTLLATLVLATAMTHQRLQDARDDMLSEGFVMLDYLAAGAEYGLLSGNEDALSAIAQPALRNPMVTDITFLDAVGQPLFGSQRPTSAQLERWQQMGFESSPGYWRLYVPVRLSSLPVDDFQSIEGPVTGLGWVLLELNDSELRQQESAIRRLSAIIAVGSLLVALWLGWVIGRTLLRPIRQVGRTVERLRHDQLDARALVDDGGELGELAQGVNQLALQIQRNRDNLEWEVQKATRELHVTLDAMEDQNRQLQRARTEAEQANQAKDEFLARMSHELRTPLTSVLGFTDLLAKTPLDRNQQEYLQVTQHASRLLLSLIDDLLDFSKLASNAIALEQIQFNFDECIERVIDMHLANARNKGIDLIFVPDPTLPMLVSGDPTRIGQVLSNLLSNAIKFTDSGEVVVSLRSERHGTDAHISLEVKDSGIGISEAQQAKLFKPFSQADITISRRFGGTGLGLVICRRLCELMGGTLELDSVEGVGTQVRLEMTLRVISEAPPPPTFNALSILLYDRNPLSLRATRRRLEYLGCRVTAVQSRRQLLAKLPPLGAPPFQRLLLSLTQRELQALHQVDFIQPLLTQFSAPVILVTALDADNLAEELPQLGDNLTRMQLLQKPFSSQALIQALEGQPKAVSTDTPVQPAAALGGLSVLVAEDNPFNQELIRRMLTLNGARVVLAANGHEALQRIHDEPIDLLLLDLHMPELDGIATATAIRQLAGPESQLPIVVLTASPLKDYQHQLSQLAIHDALNKPLNEQALISSVSRACQLDSPLPKPIQPQITPPNNPRLERYGIDDDELHQELFKQLKGLQQGHQDQDSRRMRDHTHQLMGLAGLLGLTELDQAAEALNRAVKAEQADAISTGMEQLTRLIQQTRPQQARSR